MTLEMFSFGWRRFAYAKGRNANLEGSLFIVGEPLIVGRSRKVHIGIYINRIPCPFLRGNIMQEHKYMLNEYHTSSVEWAVFLHYSHLKFPASLLNIHMGESPLS